jgi:TonB family protein
MRRSGYAFLLAGFVLFLQVAIAQTPANSTQQPVSPNSDQPAQVKPAEKPPQPVTPAQADPSGLERVGGRVSMPVVLKSVQPEYTKAAGNARYEGICLVAVIVDAQGKPQDVKVVRRLGMGLDEKAIEAVKKFKFKPAMKDGKTPVPVRMTVEINFHLY